MKRFDLIRGEMQRALGGDYVLASDAEKLSNVVKLFLCQHRSKENDNNLREYAQKVLNEIEQQG